MLHASHCVDPSDEVSPETVEKVAATIEVELDKQPTEVAISSGISAALDLPEDTVHRVQWVASQRGSGRFLGSDGRRLQVAYIISFELIVPGNLSGDVVVRKASALVLDGSLPSQALMTSLRNRGFAMGAIKQVIAPRSFKQVIVKYADGNVVPVETLTPTTPAELVESNARLSGGRVACSVVGLMLLVLHLRLAE